jgi:hypothetical protein
MEMPEWRNNALEMLNKYIIGEGTKKDFTDLIARIRRAGLDAAIAEMQDYYDKMQ